MSWRGKMFSLLLHILTFIVDAFGFPRVKTSGCPRLGNLWLVCCETQSLSPTQILRGQLPRYWGSTLYSRTPECLGTSPGCLSCSVDSTIPAPLWSRSANPPQPVAGHSSGGIPNKTFQCKHPVASVLASAPALGMSHVPAQTQLLGSQDHLFAPWLPL